MKKLWIICLCAATTLMMTACGAWGEESDEEWDEEYDGDVLAEDGMEPEPESVGEIIEDQSFEVELGDWGMVKFASTVPEDGIGDPEFYLLRDEEVVYTFPGEWESTREDFSGISAVAFRDYNGDDKTDIIVLIQYTDGTDIWNEPRIFLQENNETMFYLDYPELLDYKLEAASEEGPAFYRDFFLEDYLSCQYETDSISDFDGSWLNYIEYLDEVFYSSFSLERQLEIYVQQRDVWVGTGSMDRYCYTLADLSYNGSPILIISEFGGTGFYTYSRFFRIDETGNVVELPTSFTEFDSQPDLLNEEDMAFYCDDFAPKWNYFYIVHDDVKVSPTDYVYETGALSIEDGAVIYTRLAVQEVQYVGEDHAANVISEDFEGNSLTEEEYEGFADSYYSGLGYSVGGTTLRWAEVEDIADMSEEEAIEELARVLGVG